MKRFLKNSVLTVALLFPYCVVSLLFVHNSRAARSYMLAAVQDVRDLVNDVRNASKGPVNTSQSEPVEMAAARDNGSDQKTDSATLQRQSADLCDRLRYCGIGSQARGVEREQLQAQLAQSEKALVEVRAQLDHSVRQSRDATESFRAVALALAAERNYEVGRRLGDGTSTSLTVLRVGESVPMPNDLGTLMLLSANDNTLVLRLSTADGPWTYTVGTQMSIESGPTGQRRKTAFVSPLAVVPNGAVMEIHKP